MAYKTMPTLKRKAQIKQDRDYLQLQNDKFDQNLEIALGHDANVTRKEKALDTITNAIQLKKARAEMKNKAASKIKDAIRRKLP